MGTHLEKGYGDVRPLRPLFMLSQQFPKTPISACFSSDPFSTNITNFTKFAALEPKFMQNFHSKASNLQNSVL